MKTLSLPRVLLASAACATLGFGLAELWRGDAGAALPAAARAASFAGVSGSSALPPSPNTGDLDEDAATLWQVAQLASDPATQGEALNRLGALISESRHVFREMILRYDPQADSQTRELLRSLLVGDAQHRTEVTEFSLQLAASTDPQRRRDGFAMLADLRADIAPALKLAARALDNEHDPAVVRQAAAIVGQAAIAPAEAQALRPRLLELAGNEDASLRATGLYTLARLDKIGGAEPQLVQALADPAPEVRQAALAAMQANATRSEALKQALWTLLESNAELPALRRSAAQGIERYPLEQAEYLRLKQAESRLAQLASSQQSTTPP
jgi:hypothetical protein